MPTSQSKSPGLHNNVPRGASTPQNLQDTGASTSVEPQEAVNLPRRSSPTLRTPTAEDGKALHDLVANCPPLDPNSLYCNLLHCTHFGATSVAAVLRDPEGKEQLVGFISAYIPPQQPDTLFVWQVAVAAEGRGQGLAGRMLDHILQRPACAEVRYIDTTITPGNEASWALFQSWARRHDAPVASHVHFERERHFGGRHDEEHLMRIGPFEIAAEFAT